MLEVGSWILGVIAFIIILALSIGLHEAGHLVVAKKLKLYTPKFFVGFGPTLWSKKTKETEYGVKAIPLGGFVSIEDKRFEKDSYERQFLSRVSPWKRTLVFLAGPVVNLILGFTILLTTLSIFPGYTATTTLESVNSCSSTSAKVCKAEEAGLLAGDKIIAIDGQKLESSNDFEKFFSGKETAEITLERDSKVMTLPIELENGVIGVNLKAFEYSRTLPEALNLISDTIYKNLMVIAELPTKIEPLIATIFGAEKDEGTPQSVISVGKTYGDVSSSTSLSSSDKVERILIYSGLLNLGLGLINLIPAMPLDGGRIFIAFCDMIRGAWSRVTRKEYKPLGFNVIQSMTAITGSLVVSFMFLVILSDVLLIGRGAL